MPVSNMLAANITSLFLYAEKHEDLLDRVSPVALEEYIREQGWGKTVSKSTIYRMMDGDDGASIAVLALIASAFDLQAWHLLSPGLDPANPPVLMTDIERQLYADFKELQRRLQYAPPLEGEEIEGTTSGSSNTHDNASATRGKGGGPQSTRSKRRRRPRSGDDD